jgi:membrane dipeptidase
MSLSHNGHSQFCDSNIGEEDNVWLHDGFSDLGKGVIKEMNKWGMMIDVSHPSKESMKDMIELSKAPIKASHSSARALCSHGRDVDDEQLTWLKENGGVVQTVAFSSYIKIEKDKKYKDELIKVIDVLAKEQNLELVPRDEIKKMGRQSERRRDYRVHEIIKRSEN